MMNPRRLPWFRKALLSWYDKRKRSLPWRATSHPYPIWISEIMLQQTQVETVIPYYQRFLKKFPDLHRLAAAHEEQVLKSWEGLGYYRRARALHQAAKIIAYDYQLQLPKTAAEWMQLPGIGRYTANAIASMAYQEPVAVLDGNVKRVLARMNCFQPFIEDRSSEVVLWQLAELWLERKRPGDYNQAVMELGALVCVEKEPACHQCPVMNWCRARKLGQQAYYPKRKKRKTIPHFQVAVAVIRNQQGQWLIGQRPATAMLGGLWEFPGGKVRNHETPPQALHREIREELGVEIILEKPLPVIKHAYTHFKITLHAFISHIQGTQPPLAKYHQQLRWLTLEQFSQVPIPGANKKLLALIKEVSQSHEPERLAR